jgi:plastocyanin
MSNGDLFYVIGSLLAVSAVVVSFLGLRLREFPGRAFPLVVLWFAVLVGAATTLAVLHAKDEDAAHAAEAKAGSELEQQPNATEEAPSGAAQGTAGGEAAKGGKAAKAGGKPGKGQAKAGGAATASTTLKLAADPTQIAFDTTKLSARAGKVTIDFTNPAALEHDVAIEQNGKVLAKTPTFAEGEESVTVNLAPGSYTFLCTVPGHAQAGMEGTLTVK